MISSTSKVVDFVKGKEPPSSQTIPVSRYLRCYQVLLGELGRELPIDFSDTSTPESVSRSQLTDLAGGCARGTGHWSDLFVATMLWGYGERNDSGPVKLFRALSTPNADQIITETAEMILCGNLESAHMRIRELSDVGPSYGSKFLYACGTSIQAGVRPIVLDNVIVRNLQRILGEAECQRAFDFKALAGTHAEAIRRAAAGYAAYCGEMEKIAVEIGWSVYQLEQFLFENAKSV